MLSTERAPQPKKSTPTSQHLHPASRRAHAKTLPAQPEPPPEPPARPARFSEQPFFLPKICILIIFLGSHAFKRIYFLLQTDMPLYCSPRGDRELISGTGGKKKKSQNKPRLWGFFLIYFGTTTHQCVLITPACINYTSMASLRGTGSCLGALAEFPCLRNVQVYLNTHLQTQIPGVKLPFWGEIITTPCEVFLIR